MAVLDFPASPVVGQKYPTTPVTGQPVYTWDGQKWITEGIVVEVDAALGSNTPPLMNGTAAPGVQNAWSRGDHVHPADASKVAKSGDAMTGPLTLPADPTTALQAATKQYVDAHAGGGSGVSQSYVDGQDALRVAKAGDVMTGPLTLSADPTAALQAATKQYVDAHAGSGGGVSQAYVDGQDALRVAKTGDTMSGALNLTGTNNIAFSGSGAGFWHGSISYAQGFFVGTDAAADTFRFYSGGTSANALTIDRATGHVTVASDPTAALGVATKQYVDNGDALKVTKAGDRMSGTLYVPAVALDIAAGGQALVSFSDGGALKWLLGKQTDNSLILYDAVSTKTPIIVPSNGTHIVTQLPIQLPADPASPLDAATKQYVDAKPAGVAKTGDTMSGALHITDGTASNSTATGALTVAGGVGVGGNVVAGGIVSSTGQINLNGAACVIDSTPWRVINNASGGAAIFLGDASTSYTNMARATTHYLQDTAGNSFLYVSASIANSSVPIASSGEITAYYSDERLKKDISVIPDALEKVNALRGVYYQQSDLAKQFGFDNVRRQVGVIAQDVNAVLPEAIRPAPFDVDEKGESKSGQEYLTVQYDNLVPLLLEAIKELTQRLERLEK